MEPPAAKTRMEGWLTKHRRIRSGWSEVKKLEGNFKRRYCVVEDGTFFYFESDKKFAQARAKGDALAKSAKGFVPLHACELIENENVSEKDNTFVLEVKNGSCFLLAAESVGAKTKWVNAIRKWHQSALAATEGESEVPANAWQRHMEGSSSFYINLKSNERAAQRPEDGEVVADGALTERRRRLTRASFLVVVRPLRAKGLLAMDMGGRSDPFCRVTYGDVEYNTQVIKRNLTPDWTELENKFEFLISGPAMEDPNERIAVTCLDWDRLGAPDFLGRAELPLCVLWESFENPTEMNLTLGDHGDEKGQGEVTVQVTTTLAFSQNSGQREMLKAQFGVKLEDIAKDPLLLHGTIPAIVREMVDDIDERGVAQEGIFRLSGSANAIAHLRVKINLNWRYELDDQDVNVVAGLLKLFLREMPEPLIPTALYPRVISAMGVDKPPDEVCAALRDVVHSDDMPPIHRDTLRAVFGLLATVAANESTTRMGPKNIAVVIGPNILRVGNDASAHLADMKAIQQATEALVAHFADIFRD